MNQKTDYSSQQPIEYKEMKVKKFTVILTVVSIVLYFADIISDLSLAVNYFYDGHIKFFCLTLFLVVFSASVSSIFSFYMYWTDSKDAQLKVSKKDWVLRITFLIFGVAPILR